MGLVDAHALDGHAAGSSAGGAVLGVVIHHLDDHFPDAACFCDSVDILIRRDIPPCCALLEVSVEYWERLVRRCSTDGLGSPEATCGDERSGVKSHLASLVRQRRNSRDTLASLHRQAAQRQQPRVRVEQRARLAEEEGVHLAIYQVGISSRVMEGSARAGGPYGAGASAVGRRRAGALSECIARPLHRGG